MTVDTSIEARIGRALGIDPESPRECMFCRKAHAMLDHRTLLMYPEYHAWLATIGKLT